MKFNSFDYITPSIDDMKRLLFPFSFRNWLKLGFVSLLAGGGRGGFNPGNSFNIKIPGGGHGGEKKLAQNVTETANEVTGGAVQSAKESMGSLYYLIIPVVLAVVFLGLLMTYITSVFAFIFLEALDTKKVMIKKGWRQNQGLGVSFFLLRVVIGLIVLGFLVLITLPMTIPMLQQGAVTYFESFSLWNIAWIIPAIVIFMVFMFVTAIFSSLVYNFSVVHMYFRKHTAWMSIKATFKKINKAKLEVFLFLIAKLVINIVAGISAVILALMLFIPFILLAIPFALIFWGLVAAFGWTAAVIAGIAIVGLAWLIFFIYVFAVIFLPVSTFARYFSIHNYKALMK